MIKLLNPQIEAGSRECNEPRQSFPDTHLCVDLKLITRQPGRMPVGANLNGTITRDGEYHFCFRENDSDEPMKVVGLVEES